MIRCSWSEKRTCYHIDFFLWQNKIHIVSLFSMDVRMENSVLVMLFTNKTTKITEQISVHERKKIIVNILWFSSMYIRFCSHILPHFYLAYIYRCCFTSWRKSKLRRKKHKICDYCRFEIKWKSNELWQKCASLSHRTNDILISNICWYVRHNSTDRISQTYCGNARMQWYWFSLS